MANQLPISLERKNYAQCLLDQVHPKEPSLSLALAVDQPSQLDSRIRSILKTARRLNLQLKSRLLLVAVTFFLTSLPLLAIAQLSPLQTIPLSLFSQTPQNSEKAVDETQKKNEEWHIANKIEKAYKVKPGGNLKVISQFGTVDVQTAHRDKVEIVITKGSKFKLDPWTQKTLADFEVVFKQEGSDVHIQGRSTLNGTTGRRGLIS